MPDADVDEIVAVFYSFQGSDNHVSDETRHISGQVIMENELVDPHRLRDFELDVVTSELDLLNRIVDLVVDFDPDIIVGWEIQAASWGYLNVRGRHYGSFCRLTIFCGYTQKLCPNRIRYRRFDVSCSCQESRRRRQ